MRDENNKIISSQVNIQTEPTVVSSVVKVIEGNSEPKKMLSSIVEIKTNTKEEDDEEEVHEEEDGEEEAAIEVDGNNIDKPEYDFLNRQPSVVVDETYKVR